MGRHSKNRTSNPVVSAQEKTAWNYGSKRQRLNAESFLPFDACVLCLQRARAPVKICDSGHVYCNECVLTNLLSQKKDIKRHQASVEALKAEEASERELAREAARQRVLSDFEQSQSVLSTGSVAVARATQDGSKAERGVKRKFEMEQGEIERLVSDAEERALKQLEQEQAENRKAKLPSFWLPSLTPSAGPSKLMEEPKLTTLCHATTPPHAMTLKSLVNVHFATAAAKVDEPATYEKPAEDEPFLCWSCRDAFGKTKKIMALRPCGHIICGNCFDALAKETKACPACDKKIEAPAKGKGRDHIELARQGTGYAGGGQAQVEVFDLAFQ